MTFESIPINRFKNIEKRLPTPKPSWKWETKAINDYFQQTNEYINDRFYMRSILIRCFALIKYKLGVSTKPDRAILGKHDFAYIGNYWENVVDQTTGKDVFSPSDLENWIDEMTMRYSFLIKKGIRFYFVVAPNKHTIYPEYLPSYIVPSNRTCMNQILSASPPFPIVFLKDGLMKAKLEYNDLLYKKMDTHWSEIGAYIAYENLIRRLRIDFPKIEPFKLKRDEYVIKKHNIGGDISHMLSLQGFVNDYRIEFSDSFSDRLLPLKKTDFNGNEIPTSPITPIFVNEKAIVYNSEKPYTVLVLKDSFSKQISVYFNQTFGKIIYCHYNDPDGRQWEGIVNTYKPDFVVHEVVERALKGLVHKKKSASEVDQFKTVFHMDGSYIFRHTKQFNAISSQNVNNNAFIFTSDSKDPFFILPEIRVSENSHIILEIDISPPERTHIAVYYRTGHTRFHNEKQSIRESLKKGRNKVRLLIPEKGINTKELRIDPGTVPGLYQIHSITLLCSDAN